MLPSGGVHSCIRDTKKRYNLVTLAPVKAWGIGRELAV